MDLEHAIHTRRTVHKYLTDAVAQEDLDKMMMAGHMAPCHKLTWPWRFIQVGPQTREKIVPVAIACKTVNRERTPELEKAVRGKILTSVRFWWLHRCALMMIFVRRKILRRLAVPFKT